MKFDNQKLAKDILASGLKKGFIADKVGIHRSYFYRILKGHSKPSLEIVKKIQMVLLKWVA